MQFLTPIGTGGYQGELDIPSFHTRTFSTQPTAVYYEDVNVKAGLLDQGMGSVAATGSSLICTAQVLDPTNPQPTFMAKLPLFDANGLPVESQFIFADGFELGDTSSWSSATP